MHKSIVISLCLVLMLGAELFAQHAALDQLVTLHYTNVRLGDALQHISTQYKVQFSYSKHYVPIEKRMDLQVDAIPLSAALDLLFEDVPVIYASIGDQIVLKKDKNAQEPLLGSIQPPIRAIDHQQPAEEILTASNRPFEDIDELPILEKYNYGLPEVLSQDPEQEVDTEKYYVEAPEPEFKRAQISLYPSFGTNNINGGNEKTNNFSLNILGGENGGVDGLEVGGLFNKVKNDVNGVQIAGLFNSVGGNVGPSKLIDGKYKKTFGVQIAGLSNRAANVRAIQIAGLLNTNRGSLMGLQAAGLGNVSAGNGMGVQVSGLYNVVGEYMDGIQVAGLINFNVEDAGLQISGFSNIADDVEVAQVSGFFNRAERVNGIQFGLINVCDTVSVASIGLLNFVKKGYNQIELGSSETMHSQLALRFGSRRFYNILQFGAHFNTENAYGLGYGIGTTIQHRRAARWQWNIEAVTSQILEQDNQFDALNLLNELRLSTEFKSKKRFSIYFGPTINFMYSKIVTNNTELSPTYGSQVPLYTIWDNENSATNPTDLKLWLGFRAGIRFGKNY